MEQLPGYEIVKMHIIEFLEYLNKNNLIGIAVSFVLARMVTQMSISFGENIVSPILNSVIGSKPNFSIPLLRGNRLRIGRFLGDIIDVLVTIVIFYMFFGNSLRIR